MNPIYMNNQSRTITITTPPPQNEEEWKVRSESDGENLLASSLEESSLLYQSCIDQEAVVLNQTTDTTQSGGSALITQMTRLVESAQTLHKILQIASAENTNLITTGFTLGAGLMALWRGQIPTGFALTGAALNQIKKIVDSMGPPGMASDLLSEARTGVQMIKQLEEYQLSSLNTIEQQIDLATEQLNNIENQLKEIQSFATKGNKDAELKKQKAMQLSQKAANEYKQAIYSLQRSHTNILSISQDFKTAINALQILIEQVKTNQLKPEDFSTFVSQTEKILEQMITAQKGLDKNRKLFNEGLYELHEATNSNKDALLEYVNVCKMMSSLIEKIGSQDIKKAMDQVKETKQKLKEAQKETKIAQERSEDISAVTKHTEKKLEELQSERDNEFGKFSTMVGVGTTVLTMEMLGPASLGAGYFATYIAHSMHNIQKFATKYFSQVKPVPNIPNPLARLNIVYDPVSTGWGGYAIGLLSKAWSGEARGSKTAGSININIGNENAATYKFNKNSKSDQGKMDEKDMKILNDDLRKQLDDKKLDHQQCLAIIESLADVETEYGKVTLIAPNCIYLADLKKTCQRELENK